MAESFWKIPDISDLKVPLVLMKEQANALARQTSGLLRGEVETLLHEDDVYIYLNVVVPSLNDYKVNILTYRQPAQLYPGELASQFRTLPTIRVKDQDDLTAAMQSILGSKECEKLLGSLLAQARAR
jgi:hypothetical protein